MVTIIVALVFTPVIIANKFEPFHYLNVNIILDYAKSKNFDCIGGKHNTKENDFM